MLYWWREVPQEVLLLLLELKEEKRLLKPLAKLLIIMYYGLSSNWSAMLRELLGGNYTNVVKEGVIAGYIVYERGKRPELTETGKRVARALAKAWEEIRREGEGEKTRDAIIRP